MDASVILRVLLVITIVALAVVALLYLRRRQLEARDYLAWGLLAVCVPLLGPFLVIACRPGRWRTRQRGLPQHQRSFAQVVSRLRQRVTRM